MSNRFKRRKKKSPVSQDKKGDWIIVVSIVIIALLGLILGYFMFSEFIR